MTQFFGEGTYKEDQPTKKTQNLFKDKASEKSN